MSKDKQKRTREGEVKAYDGQPSFTTETLFKMRRIMARLKEFPYMSVTELAEEFEWTRTTTEYILGALWSAGFVSRYRASTVDGMWSGGIHGAAWLYTVVPGARKPLRKAA